MINLIAFVLTILVLLPSFALGFILGRYRGRWEKEHLTTCSICEGPLEIHWWTCVNKECRMMGRNVREAGERERGGGGFPGRTIAESVEMVTKAAKQANEDQQRLVDRCDRLKEKK